MINLFLMWLKFFICSSLLIAAGYKLCKYGDSIASKINLSRMFIGAIFLAVATSLPEFATSVGAIISVGSPDLALGDLFGTLVMNLMIMALLDLIYKKGPLMYEARRANILYAGMTVILLVNVIFGFIARLQLGDRFMFFNMSPESILLVAIYLIALWLIFSYEKRSQQKDVARRAISQNKGLAKDIFGLFFCSLLVVAGGIWLANIGNEIVVVMNWSGALVGSVFLAITTSFPELIVSISALKIGAINMAIGNILGSNLFDIMIIPLCDLFWTGKSIFASITSIHMVTISLAIIMTSIVIISLIYRSKKSILKMGWDVIAMTGVFLIGYIFIWIMGT